MSDQTIKLPPVIYGTSCLGNLYQATSFENKLAIVNACVENAPGGIAVFDTAGKYGAGLALEELGKCLKALNVPKEKVIISNKLGWYQTELKTDEPTFEPGVWKELKHDAVQKISYDGVIECFEQGNKLLGDYVAQMVSIHDPDEYLNAAENTEEGSKRFSEILDAYKALFKLKTDGKVISVGIGSKDWQVIQRVSEHVDLDWVMIANSLTIKSHPPQLLSFIDQLHKKNITVINSAVFNGGFLVGSDYYNYSQVDRESEDGKALYKWREKFFQICAAFNIKPAEACFNFGYHIPGVKSVALNTTNASRVAENVAMATKEIPKAFWDAMITEGLLESILFQK